MNQPDGEEENPSRKEILNQVSTSQNNARIRNVKRRGLLKRGIASVLGVIGASELMSPVAAEPGTEIEPSRKEIEETLTEHSELLSVLQDEGVLGRINKEYLKSILDAELGNSGDELDQSEEAIGEQKYSARTLINRKDEVHPYLIIEEQKDEGVLTVGVSLQGSEGFVDPAESGECEETVELINNSMNDGVSTQNHPDCEGSESGVCHVKSCDYCDDCQNCNCTAVLSENCDYAYQVCDCCAFSGPLCPGGCTTPAYNNC